MGYAAVVIIGAASGAVIAGAIAAFIVAIGLVTRLAQKTGTQKRVTLYEEAIAAGGIFGALTAFLDFSVNIGRPLMGILGFMAGVFYGCLAVSLAETLDVIPIMARRARLKRGLAIFVLCLALGKAAGSLVYFLVPGFFEPQ